MNFWRWLAAGWRRLDLSTERGQVIVLTTGALITMIGFVGLTLDVGIILEERRQMQNAADAASLAAARTARDDPSQAIAVAEQYLLANGVDPADPDVTIAIDTGYAPDQVEITITASVPTSFFRALGVDSKTVAVRAVGEALSLGAGNYALLTLNETACNAFQVWGNPDITIRGGGIMVNSDCPSYAGDISGNASITADAINHYAPGGFRVRNNAVTSPEPREVSRRVEDPLTGLPVPSVSTSPDSGGAPGSPNTKSIKGNGAVTLRPGAYWGGIDIGGNVDVTLEPGIYVMQSGDFQASGGGSITGDGVMIYLTGASAADCGGVDLAGNRVLNLTPMSSGPYEYITLWQDKTCQSPFKYHGNVQAVQGVIYAPGATFDLLGNTNLGAIQVISDTIAINGNVTIDMTFTSYVGDTSTGKISITE